MKMLKTKEKIRRLDMQVQKRDGEIYVRFPGGKLYRFNFKGAGVCCAYGCKRPTVDNNLLCFSCLGEAKKKGEEKELVKAAKIASLARSIKKKI